MSLFGPEAKASSTLGKNLSSLKTLSQMMDIGAGSGNFIQTILASMPHLSQQPEIYALEPFPDAQLTGEKNIPQAHWIYKDALEYLTSIPEESIDMICISKALHHFPHPEKIIEAAIRVLKKGGLWIVQEPIRDALCEGSRLRVAIHDFLAFAETALGYHHRLSYSQKELQELFSPYHKNLSFFVEDFYFPTEKDHDKNSRIIEMLKDALQEEGGLSSWDPLRLGAEVVLKAAEAFPVVPQPLALLMAQKIA